MNLTIIVLMAIILLALSNKGFFSGFVAKVTSLEEASFKEDIPAQEGIEDQCNVEARYEIPPRAQLADELGAEYSSYRGTNVLVYPTGESPSLRRQVKVHDPGPDLQFFNSNDNLNPRPIYAGIPPLPKLSIANLGPFAGEYIAYARLSNLNNQESQRELVTLFPGRDRLVGTLDDVEYAVPIKYRRPVPSYDEAYAFDIVADPDHGVTTLWMDEPEPMERINIMHRNQDGVRRSLLLTSPGAIYVKAARNGFVYILKRSQGVEYKTEIFDIGPEFDLRTTINPRVVDHVQVIGWDDLTDYTIDGKLFVYATGRDPPFTDKINVMHAPNGRIDSSVFETTAFTLPEQYRELFVRDVSVTYLQGVPQQGQIPPSVITFILTPRSMVPAVVVSIYSGTDGVYGTADDVMLPPIPAGAAYGSDNRATWMTSSADSFNGLDAFWYFYESILSNVRRC